MLKLEFPNASHKDQYGDMIVEWKSYEVPGSPSTLFRGENYEAFLQITTTTRDNPPQGFVPAELFFLVDTVTSRILGAIDIRHHVDHEYLKEYGGHIGYGIRPSERRKGYAKKILALGLEKTKELGIDRVMISCHDDNIGSAKVIEANGGVLQDIILDPDNKKLRRYQIFLNK